MGKINNYFDMMLTRYDGDQDFIVKITPEQIQRYAKQRIFREMIRGEIDYTVYGKYFLNPKFLENLIIAAQDELRNKSTIANALRFYDLYFPGSIDVVHNSNLHQNLVVIYDHLYQKLMTLKFCGDIGVLIDIQYVMKDYQKYMT